jgi:hypothetical protein
MANVSTRITNIDMNNKMVKIPSQDLHCRFHSAS